MNMQDQTRRAFGHYAKRATERAKAGDLAKAIVGSDLKVGSELNPLLMKRGDDLELPGYVTSPIADERLKKQVDDLESSVYVTPDFSAMDFDGDSLPDEKSYHRLARRARGYEAGNRTDDYVAPPKAEDISFTDVLVSQNQDNLNIDISGHGSPDVIIARPDVAKELGSTFVNGFGDVAKVVSSDDIAMDYDGDSLPDEKNYSRLVKRARGYEAGSLTDDYVQPPKADDYVVPPKDISFTDALVRQDDNKVYVDDHMRSLVNSSDTIFVTLEAAKEMGSVFVDDFGNHGKVVVKDQVGKQAHDYTAGNLTDDYVTPPKYDDDVQPPKADDYVRPPKADDYVQPPTAPDMEAFDASQFEMSNNEATNSIDDEPMGIDEGQFDMTRAKGLQQ